MDNGLRNIVGTRIKTLREKQGFSQRQFALMVGIHRNSLAKIEKGMSSVSIDVLEKIMQGLNVTAETFFHGIR